MNPKNIKDVRKFLAGYKSAKSVKTSEMYILGLLSHQDLSGYDIYKLVERTADAMGSLLKLNKATVYNTLNRLCDDGIIEIADTVQDQKKPPKTFYSLTDMGREYLRDMVLTDFQNPPLMYVNFIPALSFSHVLSEAEIKSSIKTKIEQLEFLIGFYDISMQISPGTISEFLSETKLEMAKALLNSMKKLQKILATTSFQEFIKIKEFDKSKIQARFKKVTKREA